MSYQQWILDFLQAIGAPATPQNLQFMNAWIAKESGPYAISYGWNPLNTTQPGPGSYGGGAQGNIQFFPDYQTGLNANVQTIQNGYYPDLLDALRGGNANVNTNYAGLNTWGTHSLVGYGGSAPSGSASGSSSSGSSGAAPCPQYGTPACILRWDCMNCFDPSLSNVSIFGRGGSGASSSSPGWLQNIAKIPILGAGAADLVSVGIVGAFALTFFIIGGAWLIFGTKPGQTVVKTGTGVAKTAGKVAAAAAV